MATPVYNRYVKSLTGAPDKLVMLGSFQAGATQAIDCGEILSFTADTNSDYEPVGADVSGSQNIAVANENVESGDAAGYYEVIVPRPGDVFWFEIDTAAAVATSTALKSSDSDTLSQTGSNQLCTACGQEHYPQHQRRLTRGGISDQGTTIRSTSVVLVTFKESTSIYATLQD